MNACSLRTPHEICVLISFHLHRHTIYFVGSRQTAKIWHRLHVSSKPKWQQKKKYISNSDLGIVICSLQRQWEITSFCGSDGKTHFAVRWNALLHQHVFSPLTISCCFYVSASREYNLQSREQLIAAHSVWFAEIRPVCLVEWRARILVCVYFVDDSHRFARIFQDLWPCVKGTAIRCLRTPHCSAIHYMHF